MMGRMVYYDYNGNEIEPPKADPVPMTNADKIRAMTDETMAKWLAQSEYSRWDFFAGELQKHAHITLEYPKDEAKLAEEILKWLKSPADEVVQNGNTLP